MYVILLPNVLYAPHKAPFIELQRKKRTIDLIPTLSIAVLSLDVYFNMFCECLIGGLVDIIFSHRNTIIDFLVDL